MGGPVTHPAWSPAGHVPGTFNVFVVRWEHPKAVYAGVTKHAVVATAVDRMIRDRKSPFARFRHEHGNDYDIEVRRGFALRPYANEHRRAVLEECRQRGYAVINPRG